jgi:trimeric autotransporter adhesin
LFLGKIEFMHLRRLKIIANRKPLRRVIGLLGIALSTCFILGFAGCVPTIPTLKIISISITPSAPAHLLIGTATSLDAVATYADGSTSGIALGVTWTSDNTSVATVANGSVTGVADGIANIKATFSGISSAPVQVTVVSLSSIAVTPSSPDNLPVGSNQQFTATGTYSDGSNADITSEVTWASDTTATATVSSGGLVTGIAGGIASISATLGGVTSPSIILTVEPLKSIEIAPGNPANLKVGSNQDFTAIGTLADGSIEDITSQVTWVSGAPDIAIFNYPGVVAAQSAGTATITASLSGITSSPVQLTVISLASISVTPASPENLAVGVTQQFTATGIFTDGSTEDITSEVTWLSDTPATATI